MERSVPSQTFSTGFEVEKRSLEWRIDGFSFIRTSYTMIDSQRISFKAGETTGQPSQWSVGLNEHIPSGKRWIGIFLQLKSPRATRAYFSTSHAGIRVTIRNKEGEVIKDEETGPKKITDEFVGGQAVGIEKFIDPDDANFCPEESLVILITFKLYTPSQPRTISSMEVTLETFQVKFFDQLRKALPGEPIYPIPGSDFKILSKDKKEFPMLKWVLSARSEVFAAMLRSDMTEASSGVLELFDISSKALEVFLTFVNTGVLLQEWRETEVIVELTNATGKYQLKDLLQFLDAVLGKVCQLENVGALLTLARQLSLKVAEEELMMFVREEGMGNADNFIQMWNTELPVLEPMSTSGAGGIEGRKRKRSED